MAIDERGELESLRAEVRQLARSVRELRGTACPGSPRDDEEEHIAAERAATLDPRAVALAREARERGAAGLLTHFGYYGSGERGYYWAADGRTADELLRQDDERAARVLAALGNPQRLALARAILERPGTAAELVERLGMGTTGQVYHHLKALQAADLVTQEERGVFAFRGHRAQGLLLLLAGVRDLLDTRYSEGVWETPLESEGLA